VEYVLLASDATNPVTAGPAHTWTGCKAGVSGWATFDDLDLDTYDYLVARPYGYDEVTYVAAAFDGATPQYIRVKTPGTVTDIDPADVSRNVNDCANIRLANSKAGYTYAVVEIATGKILSTHPGDGGTLTFNVTDNNTYQLVTKNDGQDVNWLKGVRVYDCPDEFDVNFCRRRSSVCATIAETSRRIRNTASAARTADRRG
jgi:hypothetical protein